MSVFWIIETLLLHHKKGILKSFVDWNELLMEMRTERAGALYENRNLSELNS
jgi:hypothetical protein